MTVRWKILKHSQGCGDKFQELVFFDESLAIMMLGCLFSFLFLNVVMRSVPTRVAAVT